jgi:hypothetical protein
MSELKPKGVKHKAVIIPINPHQQKKDEDSQKERKKRGKARQTRESVRRGVGVGGV